MRTFKSKALSALAWGSALGASTAAVLPRGPAHSVHAEPTPSLLEFDLQATYAEATFNVPCAECLGPKHTSHGDESITLSFKTHSIEEACGSANITLNGVYLPQEWNGDLAFGSGTFSGVSDLQTNAWFQQHDLDLEWETKCLHGNETSPEKSANDAAQVLTVTIKAIDGQPIDKPSGFTISFKQISPPELLRLEAHPNRSAGDKDHAEAWREPPPHLRLISAPVQGEERQVTHAPGQSSHIEDEIRELRALQVEVQELNKAIKAKKAHIESQLKQETKDFKKKLQECDSVTCVVKTIAQGAHGAWRVAYVRFRPSHHRHHDSLHPEMGRPDADAYNQAWRAGDHKQAFEGDIHSDYAGPQRPHHGTPHGPPSPPPPPPHHGGHPPPPPPPPHHGGHPPPPPPPPHHGGPPHGPDGPRGHHRESPLAIALKIVLGLLCCSSLVIVIRHRCSSLRTRTERAALREERRNVSAYRRAARKHAWRSWWHRRGRDQDRMEDYEEKRSLIQSQESILEEAMQEEIKQLRAAHLVVNTLVQAEEGRAHAQASAHMSCHCHVHPHHNPPAPYSPLSTASTYPPSTYPASTTGSIPSRPLSRTNSLPGYESETSMEPPAYEEDEDTSDMVPNGFRQYSASTTSSASSRWTPDSSIVDVSPRPSADTLRYLEAAESTHFAETTETGVGDVKN